MFNVSSLINPKVQIWMLKILLKIQGKLLGIMSDTQSDNACEPLKHPLVQNLCNQHLCMEYGDILDWWLADSREEWKKFLWLNDGYQNPIRTDKLFNPPPIDTYHPALEQTMLTAWIPQFCTQTPGDSRTHWHGIWEEGPVQATLPFSASLG